MTRAEFESEFGETFEVQAGCVGPLDMGIIISDE